MARIALIAPPCPDRFTLDPGGLPLGLAMLAAMVRETAEVAIIDARSRALSTGQAAMETSAFRPDIIGVSLPFSISERSGCELAESLRKALPDIPIIMGGIQATLRADDLLNRGFADAVALGEAEETFREVVHKFSTGGMDAVRSNPPAGIRILSRAGEPIGVSRPLIKDLDSLPLPALDLVPGFPQDYEARVIGARGCMFKCPYCASCAYWGYTYRKRAPEKVVDEIRMMRDRWRIRRVSFVNDTFNQDRAWARDIADKLIEADLGIEWGANCRADLLSEDDLELFHRAGMTSMFMGLESGSARVLKSIGRPHDPEETRDLVAYAENLRIPVHASFMIGLPDETAEDIETTLAYARELPASSLGFHIFHPLPGSEFGENPGKYGYEWDTSAVEHGRLGAIDAVAPIRTKHLAPMEILDYYYRARGIAEERRRAKNP